MPHPAGHVTLEGDHQPVLAHPDLVVVFALLWAEENAALTESFRDVFRGDVTGVMVDSDDSGFPAEERLQLVVSEVGAGLVEVRMARVPETVVCLLPCEQEVGRSLARIWRYPRSRLSTICSRSRCLSGEVPRYRSRTTNFPRSSPFPPPPPPSVLPFVVSCWVGSCSAVPVWPVVLLFCEEACWVVAWR